MPPVQGGLDGDAVRRSASAAADTAVHTAEAIVEHAWVLELVRQCDHEDFALQAHADLERSVAYPAG